MDRQEIEQLLKESNEIYHLFQVYTDAVRKNKWILTVTGNGKVNFTSVKRFGKQCLSKYEKAQAELKEAEPTFKTAFSIKTLHHIEKITAEQINLFRKMRDYPKQAIGELKHLEKSELKLSIMCKEYGEDLQRVVKKN